MTTFLAKLNLRPQEQRLVVIVGLIVFVALNFFFVLPQFGKVDFWHNRRKGSEDTLKKYKDEVGKVNEYKAKLKLLESEGVIMGSDEAISSLSKDVNSLAVMSGVAPERYEPVQRSGRTNAFFDEAGLRITVTTGEKELVDFLYNLGARNSLIRVRSISLSPDPSQTRLKGTIEFVQSFPKKSQPGRTSSRPGTAATASTAPGAPVVKTAAVGSTNLARAAIVTKTNAPASSGNWFTKLVGRFTGSSTPPTVKTNAPAKGTAPVKSPAKAPVRTNTAAKTPPIPVPK